MESWTCPKCSLSHALKSDADPKCFRCGAELERNDREVDPAATRTLEVLRPPRN